MLKAHAIYRFSGLIAPNDKLHVLAGPAATTIPPSYVDVPGVGRIPQYSPTVIGSSVSFNPGNDCQGYFTSSKFQVNNNCYNYACNIATNSFAQPGRAQGKTIAVPVVNGDEVARYAQMDGLVAIGDSASPPAILKQKAASLGKGHFVALVISLGDNSISWPGDYHWVRCDNMNTFDEWSQKDGSDQVTNFDFAGQRIADPSNANWTVNQGPMISGSPNDVIISYKFYAWMFVPESKVSII
jgi:hypothetical protein